MPLNALKLALVSVRHQCREKSGSARRAFVF